MINLTMASKVGKILVVDDNLGIRRALEILLPMHFEEVKTIPSPATLVSSLEQFRPDVVLLDMNFNTSINTGNEGLYWAGEIKKMVPDVEVVLFTAYADIALAVEGMKRGAFDFIVKPWDNEKLIDVLTAARDKARKAMKRDGRKADAPAGDSPMFWGSSKPMAAIRKTLEKIAPTDATVLITGENGTGKDVLAREIHAHSLRSGKPMVAVDAGAVTETLTAVSPSDHCSALERIRSVTFPSACVCRTATSASRAVSAAISSISRQIPASGSRGPQSHPNMQWAFRR
jgi:DNA-binding NtrC family response regulator